MRNTSPFQGWKELTGDYGTVSFEDTGTTWAVYLHENGQRVYKRRIVKYRSETNEALYERYHLLSIGYTESQIPEIKRFSKKKGA